MEQNIIEDSLILLRYKFYSFYDLNPKVRFIFVSLFAIVIMWLH